MKKRLDQFNDATLINIAKSYYFSKPLERTEELDGVLKKDKLSNSERNRLLFLIESNRHKGLVSISSMKAQIFEIIGHKTSNQWGTTVNRSDMEAIYNYIITQPGQK